jgi:hypothetical protein
MKLEVVTVPVCEHGVAGDGSVEPGLAQACDPAGDKARVRRTPSAGSGTGPSTSPRPTAPPTRLDLEPRVLFAPTQPKPSPAADADSPPHQLRSETLSGSAQDSELP